MFFRGARKVKRGRKVHVVYALVASDVASELGFTDSKATLLLTTLATFRKASIKRYPLMKQVK